MIWMVRAAAVQRMKEMKEREEYGYKKPRGLFDGSKVQVGRAFQETEAED
jgi:hypothetical protein